MTQRIYIFLWLKQEGSESITEMNQVKKKERKKNEREKRKERKRRDKPVHFSWHWLTCSYTIVEWGQSGKISHPLHGLNARPVRGDGESPFESRRNQRNKVTTFFWQRMRRSIGKSGEEGHLLKAQNSYSAFRKRCEIKRDEPLHQERDHKTWIE